MKKIYFSLSRFRRITYTFFILSVLLTLACALVVYFTFSAFSSFSKGASLLMIYTEDYYIVRTSKDELISKKMIKEVEEKFGGFIVFYDLLNFRDREYEEIREVWKNFGMTDRDIFVVVIGTKMFRIIPGLMDSIKRSASEIYENINNIGITFNEEEFYKLRGSLRKFLQSFTDTMMMTITYFVIIIGIAVVYWVAAFGYFIITDVEKLRIIVKKIYNSIFSFIKEGKEEKIDILDERSVEFIVLQDATNTIIDRSKLLKSIISGIENQLTIIIETIEINSYSIYEVKVSIENLMSNLLNFDKAKIEQNINNLSNTFSILQKYTYNIKEMFEDFRSRSQNIFEPVETLYEIISRSSEEYNEISKSIVSYLKENNIFTRVISDTLNKQSEEISKTIESLRRISLNLKNIGINASVEFSRIETSSAQALFQISRKIIDTSSNLQDLVVQSSIFLENVKINVDQNINKVNRFLSIVDELYNDIEGIRNVILTLLGDREKVIENIRSNYTTLSSISGTINEIEKGISNMNAIYYSLDNNIRELVNLSTLVEDVKPILGILESTYSSLMEVKGIFSSILEELKKH